MGFRFSRAFRLALTRSTARRARMPALIRRSVGAHQRDDRLGHQHRPDVVLEEY
jgi:hypothetical protein